MPVEGRDLSFKRTQYVVRDLEIGATYQTPKSVQKLQTGVATRKRRRKPAIASTPCMTRSAARTSWRTPMPSALQQRAHRVWTVRICGHRRVLGCSGALANWRLRSGTRLTDRTPFRRVFSEGNGKLRPLGISILRDRVCMTAAMLVLEPIFEADLPPEQYAYRPGRMANRRWSRWKSCCSVGHPEVVDADLADYFGSIPHAELLKSVARRIVDRARAASDQDVGWNAPWKKTTVEEGRRARPRPGQPARHPAKVHPFTIGWRISTCAGSCWDGRCSGWSKASALAS